MCVEICVEAGPEWNVDDFVRVVRDLAARGRHLQNVCGFDTDSRAKRRAFPKCPEF
jgi:hypothetical protein